MNRLLQKARAGLMVLAIPLLTLVISIAALVGLALFRLPPALIHRILPHWWGKIIVRGCGVRVQLEGEENLVAGQPYIFAANHQSQFDIFVLHGFFRYDFRWLAKKELFAIPVFGPAMRLAGNIPVDRSHGRQAVKSLAEAAARIAQGTAVVIFPEGTRSADGRLQPFKSGVMVLAIKAGVPIVPIGISGSYEVLPKGKLLPRPGRITVRIGTPIATTGYSQKQKGELAQLLHDQVAQLLERDGEV